MSQQEILDYQRIALAIEYITEHFQEQPSLDIIAEKVCLSPLHFQKLFKKWAGTTPKKFVQYLSISHAKNLLKNEIDSLFDVTVETGLSSTSRLHDLFVSIEGMTPTEFKNGGKNLQINYSFQETLFGTILVASTQKGICFLEFVEDNSDFEILKNEFPNALFIENFDELQQLALNVFSSDHQNFQKIKLHLKGSPFQLKVWECLLKIPFGKLTTYGKIASEINQPKASRAVGTAIGSNWVAYLIPCHRVIQSSGKLGGYKWGLKKKNALIGWESALNNKNQEHNDE